MDRADTLTADLERAERHRIRSIAMALAAVALIAVAAFTLTRADAGEGPDHQRVVVQTEGEPFTLLGVLEYAGFVEFELSQDHTLAVERVMRADQEPDVLASEISRTLGSVVRVWVEDVG